MNLKKLRIEKSNSKNRICQYLHSVNSFFIPRLSSYVSIEAYSTKLSEFANVYFVLYDGVDVGMIAFYLNFENKKAFITSISVQKKYQKYGIGKILISLVDNMAVKRGITTIELQVHCENEKGINFYFKNNFVFKGQCGKQILLSKSIC